MLRVSDSVNSLSCYEPAETLIIEEKIGFKVTIVRYCSARGTTEFLNST